MWSTVPWLSINKSNIHLFSSPRCALFPTVQIITRARSLNNQTVTIMWKMIREQNNPTNNHWAIWHLTIDQIAIAGLQISIKIPKINHRLGSDQSKLVFTLSSPALHFSMCYVQSHWIYCKIKICIFQNPNLSTFSSLFLNLLFLNSLHRLLARDWLAELVAAAWN